MGAKRVFIVMEHNTREGEPPHLQRYALPVTAVGVVKLVGTDLGLFEVTPQGFKLSERVPGWGFEQVQEQTGTKLIIADQLREIRLRGES